MPPQPNKRGPYQYAKSLPPPATQLRVCLGGCDREFRSEGPHHRICGRCRAVIDVRLRGLSPQAYRETQTPAGM